MAEYTPTTEEVRADYLQTSSWRIPHRDLGAAFDRWLAAHDREVAAFALESAREDVPPLPPNHARSYVRHWLLSRAVETREATS